MYTSVSFKARSPSPDLLSFYFFLFSKAHTPLFFFARLWSKRLAIYSSDIGDSPCLSLSPFGRRNKRAWEAVESGGGNQETHSETLLACDALIWASAVNTRTHRRLSIYERARQREKKILARIREKKSR